MEIKCSGYKIITCTPGGSIIPFNFTIDKKRDATVAINVKLM